jgi:hypothetical protein
MAFHEPLLQSFVLEGSLNFLASSVTSDLCQKIDVLLPMLQPSWFHSPFPISQTILQQAPLVPPPSFKSLLSKVGSKMHLHRSAMLPLVPLI